MADPTILTANKSQYDVFFCHNSREKEEVEKIREQLKQKEIRAWLDKYDFEPFRRWQDQLEEIIPQIKAVAVFIGSSGVGPWADIEMREFLVEFAKRQLRMGLVILPGCPQELIETVPRFMKGFHWVDFRQQVPDPIEQLIWGITGQPSRNSESSPNSPHQPYRTQPQPSLPIVANAKNRLVAGGAILLVGLGLTGIYLSSRPSDTGGEILEKIKDLQVDANSVGGEVFTNPENKPIKVNFNAIGKWIAIPDYVPDVPIRAKGELSVNGVPDYPNNRGLCSGRPMGALVVIREDNSCKAIGESGSFELKPQERIHFKMNDTQFSDNSGQIHVRLSW